MSAAAVLFVSSVASVEFVISAQILDKEASILYSNGITMLIGLISDTHIAFPHEVLPSQIESAFSGVDLILHAGDIWIPPVLDKLESIAPVMACWGDDDMDADFADDSRMVKGHALLLDGVTLWLMHIKPRYALINPEKDLLHSSRFSSEDPEDPPDVVVFGHSHFAQIEYYKDVLFVNPGSATFPSYLPKLGSVALLAISSGEVEAHIVPLADI